MKPSRIVTNLVGLMLFVQVILGGSALLLGVPIFYHLVWGAATFIMLVVATFYASTSATTFFSKAGLLRRFHRGPVLNES